VDQCRQSLDKHRGTKFLMLDYITRSVHRSRWLHWFIVSNLLACGSGTAIVFPVRELGLLCKQRGITVMIDAAQ
jgi:hypothetical protein